MKPEYIQLISVVLGLLGSGGFLAGIYALLKLRPEAGQITVTAAQGAVIVQSGVIDSLRQELNRLSDELEDMRKELGLAREENGQLRTRIKMLETK